MNKYVISKEKRKKLGDFIKNKRETLNLGLNQLSIKIDVTTSLIHRLENGQTQKISPFLLKEVARGLRIDYKELFKIVGYLDDEDFSEDGKLNPIESVNENTELEDFTKVITSLPEKDLKEMLQSFLDKKELEAFKDGTYEEKKAEFDLIRQAIKNGVE